MSRHLVIEPTRITVNQFLEFEDTVRRVSHDVHLLKTVSVNHGDSLRELLTVTSNTVSKAELMAAMATTTTKNPYLRTGVLASNGLDDGEGGPNNALSESLSYQVMH